MEKMELIPKSKIEERVKVRRTRDNVRSRPNGHMRQDPALTEQVRRTSSVHFINATNLEWLSINYRKERAAKMSRSKRRIIFLMF